MANTIEIIVNAQNNADAALGSAADGLAAIVAQAGAASGALGGLTASLAQMAPALAPLAGVAGIGVLAAKTAQYAENAYWADAANERLEKGFVRLSGSEENSQKILESMRETLQGTASDTEIMAEMNKAMSLTGIRDAQTWARAMEIATVRGRELGMTTNESMESMATGVGRLSAKWLDNMGIIVDAERAYKNYAGTIGVAAENLTEMQKREAFLQDIITYNAEVRLEIDDMTAKEQAQAAAENLKTMVDEYVSGLGIVETTVETVVDVKTRIAEGAGEKFEDILQARQMRDQINSVFDEALTGIAKGMAAGFFSAAEAGRMAQELSDRYTVALAGAKQVSLGLEPSYSPEEFQSDIADMGIGVEPINVGLQLDPGEAEDDISALGNQTVTIGVEADIPQATIDEASNILNQARQQLGSDLRAGLISEQDYSQAVSTVESMRDSLQAGELSTGRIWREQIGDIAGLTDQEVGIDVRANTASAEAQLERLTAQQRQVEVAVNLSLTGIATGNRLGGEIESALRSGGAR